MLPQMLVVASAAILLLLGSAHMLFTFAGPKFLPRDRELGLRMQQVSPVISAQTTMWKAWVGFNASHSLGAMLFGSLYGYLALRFPALLFSSHFLGMLGLLSLLVYAVLGWRYWFNVPFAGILLALFAYVAGFGIAWSPA